MLDAEGEPIPTYDNSHIVSFAKVWTGFDVQAWRANLESPGGPTSTNFIDPIAALIKQYASVPLVAIIEPDSLPNLATNLGNPNCANTATGAAMAAAPVPSPESESQPEPKPTAEPEATVEPEATADPAPKPALEPRPYVARPKPAPKATSGDKPKPVPLYGRD